MTVLFTGELYLSVEYSQPRRMKAVLLLAMLSSGTYFKLFKSDTSTFNQCVFNYMTCIMM